MKTIGKIYTDFDTKFGLPRQSGLCEELKGEIVFDSQFRRKEAFRGLEGFSHIWILWQFSESVRDKWSPTVRPPRLGGNKRMGVFATRSPFRPNNIGLSCVKLEKIDYDEEQSPVLYISGIDMMNGTPVYDIKPYIPIADCKFDATDGYTAMTKDYKIKVNFSESLCNLLPEDKRKAAIEMLSLDPRPSYIDDENRVFGVNFAGYDIRFNVKNNVLNVLELIKNDCTQ